MPSRSDLLGKEVLSAVASATASTATATVTAPTAAAAKGITIFVTGFWISGSAAPTGTVSATLKDGSTTLVQLEIPTSAFAPIRAAYNTHPFRITPGNNAVLTLPSLGGSGVGTVVLEYYIGTD